jgi:hypothetical protein
MSAEGFVVVVLVVALLAALSLAISRLVPQTSLVPIFGDIGYTRSWRNEISGTFEGRRFVAFEYMYAIGGGRYGGGDLSAAS